MKNKILFFLSFLFFFSVKSLNAQVTYALPTDFKMIKKRTLLVQLRETNKNLIEYWTTKKEKAKKEKKIKRFEKLIEEHKKEIENYNTTIKQAVEKVWDLNPEILYKTETEVKKLKKSRKYTVLWFSESKPLGLPSNTTYDGIPTLNYSRIEKTLTRVDFSHFLLFRHYRPKNEWYVADFVLSLKMMKRQIEEIERTGRKKYTFPVYANDQAIANCENLKGKDVAILPSSVYIDFEKATSVYTLGKIIKYTNERFADVIDNEKDVIIGICVPHGAFVQKSRSTTTNTTTIQRVTTLYFRLLVNAKTGEVYASTNYKRRGFNSPYFIKNSFSQFNKKCGG